jgi:hypothetical protein
MTYPNRLADNSAPKTLRDYRRDEEMRDSAAYNRSLAAKQGAETRKRNAAKAAAKAAMEALSAAEQADICWEVLMGQVAKSRAIGLETARAEPSRADFFNLAPHASRVVGALTSQLKSSRVDINYAAQQATKKG